MPLLSPSNINQLILSLTLLAGAASAQQLPDGPGKAETEKLCSNCHELARSVSLRQDRAGWSATIDKMVAMGATASDAEIRLVTDYLAAHFAGEDLPPIHINKARAIELESGLSLKRSESAAIIEYRTQHGPFKSLDDLKKVPGLDAAKIDAKKDRLSFDN
jgi:competence protein ComEA